MASGLSMPVGFKNGTDGSVETAINALTSSLHEHRFIGIDQDGKTCILHTTGNPNGHVILRGGRGGPNYHDEHVEDAVSQLEAAGIEPSLLIDCSHANSMKDFSRQNKVFRSLIRQRSEGQDAIVGFMLESNLNAGRQDIPDDPADLAYGVSVTDPCIGWEETHSLLSGAHAELDGSVAVPPNVSR
jgi:3-deoxy-7-phosphoheptulonate synthase